MIGSGKHSSLLQYGNNYCHKKFYSTGPRCLFFFVTDDDAKLARVFFSSKPFHPSLTFECKATSLPWRKSSEHCPICVGSGIKYQTRLNKLARDKQLGFKFTFRVLHSSVGSWSYPQTLDQVGNTCQGQTLQHIKNIRCKSFITLGPGENGVTLGRTFQ